MDLKTWMEANGVTDQKIAEDVGVSRGYISKIKRGWANLTLSTALRIRSFSKGAVDLEQLLPKAERPPTAMAAKPTTSATKKPVKLPIAKPVAKPVKQPVAAAKPAQQKTAPNTARKPAVARVSKSPAIA